MTVSLFTMVLVYGQEQRKPVNVLFFAVDDLRPNLGCYGDTYAKTPNIDELARRGVVFSRAYSQQAVCNPSRASMLTGRRPDETGVYNLQTHFRERLPDAVSLPEAFKNTGYLTVGTGKIFHALKATLDPQSWSLPVPQYENNNYITAENLVGEGAKQNVSEKPDVPDTAYVDGLIANDAIRFLELAKVQDKPFFLGVGFKKPHLPFCAPRKYWDEYEGVDFTTGSRHRPLGSPEIAYHDWQELRGYRDIPDEGPIPEEKEQDVIKGYYACISYIDAQLGKVIDALDRLGFGDNTIIVLWGDHGYHLGEQGLWCKSTNFELDTRIPLIIAAPGTGKENHVTDAIVEAVDIYPTLIDLCGVAPRGELSGISLKPLLYTPDIAWEHLAFSQFPRPYGAINRKVTPTHMGYSVRTDQWRCTYWFNLANGTLGERELYYLGSGSLETQNLAGNPDYVETEKQLEALIIKYKSGQYRKDLLMGSTATKQHSNH